jgi:hypothetical protein
MPIKNRLQILCVQTEVNELFQGIDTSAGQMSSVLFKYSSSVATRKLEKLTVVLCDDDNVRQQLVRFVSAHCTVVHFYRSSAKLRRVTSDSILKSP